MSWTISVGPVKVGELDAALNVAVSNAKVQYGTPAWQGVHIEMWAQMDAAKLAVIGWVHSGAMGVPAAISERLINATMSGHANPKHEHRRGYAEDAMSVSVWYETVNDPWPDSGVLI